VSFVFKRFLPVRNTKLVTTSRTLRVTLSHMPGKRRFEEQLAALDALRQLPPEACIDPLHKALAHRNNFVVAKAADLVRSLQLAQLVPELLKAFDRFFEDPIETDPHAGRKTR